MQAKSTQSLNNQGSLFQPRFSELLDQNHSLYKLSGEINWSVFEKSMGKYFDPGFGRPALSVRLMVGLHYLKSVYNVSDERVVSQFVENPYWQYFCGYEYFQYSPPCNPTSLVHWRKRFGEEGFEQLFSETVSTALRLGALKEKSFNRVNVDTTVQEKSVEFPTDSRLYHKMRRKLVKAAKSRSIELRQSYERVGQESFVKQGRYARASQFKRARRETKRLRVYLGRVIRDIERKCTSPDKKLQELLDRGKKIFSQKREDKNKVYSVHAPEVECIAKGKAHKKYEFGNKVSVVSTSDDNFCVGIKSFHGNPFDGHTLKAGINQMERVTGYLPEDAYVDKGYRGKEHHPKDVNVHLPKKKKTLSRSERKNQRRRNAIEAIIGHLKNDHRMDRNYLLGKEGDKINALLAGAGFNLKKLLNYLKNFFIMFGGNQLREIIKMLRMLESAGGARLEAQGGAG